MNSFKNNFFSWCCQETLTLCRVTHWVKNICIRSFSSPNVGKYGPEKLQIRTVFTQWLSLYKTRLNTISFFGPLCSCIWNACNGLRAFICIFAHMDDENLFSINLCGQFKWIGKANEKNDRTEEIVMFLTLFTRE